MSKTITLTRPTKIRMPKGLASRVDAFYRMQQARIAYSKQIKEAEKVVSELKQQEEEVAKTLAAELRKQGGTKLSGKVATFSPSEIDVFTVDDWEQYYGFIVQNDAFELLERRPSRAALKERLQDNDLPPGVKPDKKFTFHLTKASR